MILVCRFYFLLYFFSFFNFYPIQIAEAAEGDDRIGAGAYYIYLWPNVMLNRYGPWLDVNIVRPISPNQCRVDFHWYMDRSVAAELSAEELQKMVDNNFIESDNVQQVFVLIEVSRLMHKNVYLLP